MHRLQRGYARGRRRAIRAYHRLTPYVGLGSRFAIPVYIVACESGGDWNAVNPSSGAFGAYQELPSTYSAYCHSCDGSHMDQHRVARDVWNSVGPGAWACA